MKINPFDKLRVNAEQSRSIKNLKLKIIFFGSSKHVIPIIEVLKKNFDLAIVFTTEKNSTDSVPSYCIKSKVCYYVVTDFRHKRIIQRLTKTRATLGVLASFGAILPNEVLSIFPKGIINIHPSLLPKYRGPTPVQTAILNGDKKTGISIIKLDEEVDHGPILAQVEEPIFENDTGESLYNRLFRLGSSSIVDTIELYVKGKVKLKEQNHAKATFTKRLTREDGYIDISKLKTPASQRGEQNSKLLNRMIRAYHPWPGAWTRIGIRNNESGIRHKILKFLPSDKIQVEGKMPMGYKDFINGYLKVGKEILEKLKLS